MSGFMGQGSAFILRGGAAITSGELGCGSKRWVSVIEIKLVAEIEFELVAEKEMWLVAEKESFY